MSEDPAFYHSESEPVCPHLCMEGFMQAFILARAATQTMPPVTPEQFAMEAEENWEYLRCAVDEPDGGDEIVMNG